MTLADLRKRVCRRIAQPDYPDSEVTDRIDTFINDWHRRILSKPVCSKLREIVLTSATVADQAVYAAPPAFNKIRYISERTTDRRLTQRSLEWYRTIFTDPTASTGNPDYWVPMGVGRVAVQPSAAAEIFIKSTSGSDVGIAYAEVIRTGGYRASLSVTMTGTTAASFSSTITDVVAIVDVHVSAVAVGTVTVHQTSGAGTELARIPIGAAHPRYLLYALAPTPSSAITLYLDGIVDVVDMTAASDEPLIPLDFQDLLVDGAVYEEWKSNKALKMPRAEINDARVNLEMRIGELRSWLWTQPEGPAVVPRPLASQFAKIV